MRKDSCHTSYLFLNSYGVDKTQVALSFSQSPPFIPPPIRKKSHFCKTCCVSFIFGSAFSASVEQSGRLARGSSTKYFKLCRTTPVGECPEQATWRVTVTTIQLDVYGRTMATVKDMADGFIYIIFHYFSFIYAVCVYYCSSNNNNNNYYYYYCYYCCYCCYYYYYFFFFYYYY